MARSRFSWDAFAGGVAKGKQEGEETEYRRGVLEDAAERRKLERLKLIGQYPDIAGKQATIESDTGAEPLTEIGGGRVEAGPPGLGELGRAREAARGKTALSPEFESALGSVTDTESEMARIVREQRKREETAQGLLEVTSTYLGANKKGKMLAEQQKRLMVELKAADAAGDEDKVAAISPQLKAVNQQLQAVAITGRMAEYALRGHGVDEEDIKMLDNAVNSQVARDSIIRKYAGTGRARKAGERTR